MRATLDGENVTTDDASRTASKADVSALASQTSVDNVKTAVDARASQTSLDAAKTSIDGLPVSVRTEMEGAGHSVASIKSKTDSLTFTNNDVRATLDGENVTTDDASRTASKADVSALASQTSVDNVKTAVDARASQTSLDAAKTSIDGLPVSVRTEMEGAGHSVASIKSKTDSLTFTNNDVRATLDGENVTTDGASRTASKADVSALASQASVDAVKTVVDAIPSSVPSADDIKTALEADGTKLSAAKDKLDDITITGGDVKVTLAGELVRVPHRVFVIWDSGSDKIVVWDESGHHLARFDFDIPWTDVVGITELAGKIYVAVQPSGEACTIHVMGLDGTRMESEDFTLSEFRTIIDISASAGTIYGYHNGGTIYPYDVADGTERTGTAITGIQNPRALDTWDGHHYILSQTDGQIRAYDISTGTEDTGRRITLHTTGDTPINTSAYGIAVDGSGIRVLDRAAGIFSYELDSTLIPKERIDFANSDYTFMVGIALARAADLYAEINTNNILTGGALTPAQSSALTAIKSKTDLITSASQTAAAIWDRAEVDVDAGIGQHIKDQIAEAITHAQDASWWSQASIEVTDTEVIFYRRDTGAELGRFELRSTTTDTDWSGGYANPP